MHEVNISPPLSLVRFSLTQQLIYTQSKIKKHNVSLDIFVSDTSIARNLHLPVLEKKHFSFIRTCTLFSIRFRYLCFSIQKTFEYQFFQACFQKLEYQGLIMEVKKLWEESKQSEALAAGKYDSCHTVNS